MLREVRIKRGTVRVTSPSRLNFCIKTVLIFGWVATSIKTVLIWNSWCRTPADGR